MNKGHRADIANDTKSRRVVSNAMVLFVRMSVITVINLYAVRLVLGGLGEIDYGLYNTIIGVVTLSTFISSVLSQSIQRFYSFSLGEQDYSKLQEIFSASVNIAFILIVLVILVLEPAGLWLINSHLSIPPERLTATIIVFQLALCSFLCSILQIPYTAAIFSHEDMGIYAIISTVECLLKLGAAVMMTVSPLDHLVVYGVLLFAISVVILGIYYVVARRYEECRYKKISNPGFYRELLSFSGWTFLGVAASAGIIQGNSILLNIFYGPLSNASFGIAVQINNAFTVLYNCIIMAFRPAIIKAYAEQQHGFLTQLFSFGNKTLLYALLTIGIPLLFEMPMILHLWLGDVSATTILFSRLIIVYIICMAMNGPITTVVQATGRIKEYHIPVESVTLLCVPVTFLLFYLGVPSWGVFCSMTGLCILAHFVRLFCLRQCYPSFSIRHYFTALIIPSIMVCLLAVCFALVLHRNIENTYLRLGTVLLVIPLMTLLCTWFIGMSQHERTQVTHYVRQLYINKV